MFEVQQAAAGEWAVVAAGGRALLVATADRERLLGYHDAVRSGFAETLDALVASGLSRTPAFALLDASQQTLLLAVRGETGARIHETGGGQRELRASGVSSWVEVQLSEAAQVSLGTGGFVAGGAGLPLADGVGAAHQRGITHRDLKPANVMIASDGRLKILDFGLAKIKEDLRADEPALPTAALTGEGRIVGTVNYMSPEQAEAKAVDQRSDVFSLGVILYEMLTGQTPFKGHPGQVLFAHLQQPAPDARDFNAAIPESYSLAIMQAMAKNAASRWRTAGEMVESLSDAG